MHVAHRNGATERRRVMSNQDTIRAEVSEAYTRVLDTQPAAECGCGPVQKGVAAKLAGYQAEQLKGLPDDAVTNSFGCGDPVAFSGVGKGDVVLDLGSGAGIDLLVAAQKVGPTGRVIGVDMTEAMIDKARANIAEAGLNNVEVREGIIEKLPIEDASVDWVISNCVINLSPDKPKVFAEIARVLKPGGRMIVSDIVAEEIPGWVRENKALYNSCIAGAISEAAYVAGLERAGLTDVAVQDRLVYDTSQIDAFFKSELNGGEGCCTALSSLTPEMIEKMSTAAAGKIWSARVYGRKPECC